VAIRGPGPGGNFCSCPDYATSELGTCKHLEFTWRGWRRSAAPSGVCARLPAAFSELYLRNEGKRVLHFRAGTDCPPALRRPPPPVRPRTQRNAADERLANWSIS